MPKTPDDDLEGIEFDEDDEPIPARRDTKIFEHKKDPNHKDDEEFEEDVFV